jgi:hypothetical protein
MRIDGEAPLRRLLLQLETIVGQRLQGANRRMPKGVSEAVPQGDFLAYARACLVWTKLRQILIMTDLCNKCLKPEICLNIGLPRRK